MGEPSRKYQVVAFSLEGVPTIPDELLKKTLDAHPNGKKQYIEPTPEEDAMIQERIREGCEEIKRRRWEYEGNDAVNVTEESDWEEWDD